MNAKIFDRIYNLSNLISIGEELIIHAATGHANGYIAYFKIKPIGGNNEQYDCYEFMAETEEELKEKSDNLIASYEKFKECFMNHKNIIVDCDVK